jgi:hypothetical protein
MRTIHVDYESLSDFEKSLRDSILPFYAYTSRIGRYVVDELASRPGGKYSQALRALDKIQTSDEDTYVPQTMRERTGIPLSEEAFGSFAKPGPGLHRFVANIDFPGMAAINLGASVQGNGLLDSAEASAISTLQNVGSMAAPHLRTAAELWSGTDLYTKEKLGKGKSDIDRIIGDRIGDEDFRLGALPNAAIDLLLPGAGRAISATKQAVDARIEDPATRFGQMAWNQVAPFRFHVVDAARQRDDAARMIDDMIARDPASYTIENTVVPKEDFDQLSPEMQQLVLLKQALAKAEREEKKAKERAAKLSLR